jgi:hypothetical protein
VNNTGTIQADGGKVFLTTQAATGLLNTVVNNTGLIQTQNIQNHKGSIVLLGDMKNGTVHVGGTLDASAPNGGDGGFIETSAARVKISNSASITTKAANGNTGEWLIDPVDFTIAASDGDITGTDLSSKLDSTDVSIASNTDANGIQGNLNVNQAVSWNKNKLTLTANDVNINALMTVNGSASLALNPTGKVNVALGASGFTGRVDFASTGALTIKEVPQTVITDQAGLQRMSLDLAGHYVLGNNIETIDPTTGDPTPFIPIGESIYIFKGSLDGLGHTVNDLNINTPTIDYVGLFSYVNNQGDIRNIGIVNANIKGKDYVGALAGLNGGSIANSYSSGTVDGVNGVNNVGGLIGYSSTLAQINNSYSSVNVTGTATVGGLVGANNTFISNSYATGEVTGVLVVGGLAGENGDSSTINNSYATGKVLGNSNAQYTGGLIGKNNGVVNNSYATGETSGNTYVGGLAGGNFTTSNVAENNGTINNSYATGLVNGLFLIGGLVGYNGDNINNSYATGAVTAFEYAGGLVGYSIGTINNSYATGAVTASDYVGGLIGFNEGVVNNSYAAAYTTGSSLNIGGLIGFNDNGSITNSYWKNETNINLQGIGSGTSTGVKLLEAAEMTNQSNFVGFDFTQSVWGFNPVVNNNYPILCAISICTNILGTVYVKPTAGSNVYGTAPVFNYTLVTDTGSLFNLINASLTGTATNTSDAPTASSNAGNYTFSYASGFGLSGRNASRYLLTAWTPPTNWTVNKALLTVTADNKSRLYGEVNPDLTVTVSGFVNGDTAATADGYFGSGKGFTTANALSSVGTAVITASANDLMAKNYDFTNLVDGTLTIKPLPVTTDYQTRYFAAINPRLTQTNTGFVLDPTFLGFDVTGSEFGSSTAAAKTEPGAAVFTGSRGTLTSINDYLLEPVNGVLTIVKKKRNQNEE